jgi:hypothetical protein
LKITLKCVDPVVGGILAGWRYDISGIAPEMSGDYLDHLATCDACRARQRFHRTIDIGLMVLSSMAAVFFMVAFGAIYYLSRVYRIPHAFALELLAIGGFCMAIVIDIMVAIATPAPLVVKDAAREGVRRVHEHLPEEIRSRIPEELRVKLSGQ